MSVLWELLDAAKENQPAGGNAKPIPFPGRDNSGQGGNPVLVYVDPELDEIRYGGFEQHDRTIAPLRGLNVHLNEKFKVAFCEDNQATIHIIQTGNSAQLRHADRTQRTSLAWLREPFTKGFFNLVNVNTVYQVADILTKPFNPFPLIINDAPPPP